MTEDKYSTQNLVEDDLYRVKDGKMIKMQRPASGFGKHTILYQEDKISCIETTYTEK